MTAEERLNHLEKKVASLEEQITTGWASDFVLSLDKRVAELERVKEPLKP